MNQNWLLCALKNKSFKLCIKQNGSDDYELNMKVYQTVQGLNLVTKTGELHTA